MRVAVTGAYGFLGWHLRSALLANQILDVVPIGRAASTGGAFVEAVAGCDVVFHLAGVNRSSASDLVAGNLKAASDLTAALDASSSTPTIVNANSTQVGNGTPYGDGKARAAEHLAAWGARRGACVYDIQLPNLFGEHGLPNYNSVVATFADQLARGEQPRIIDDRVLTLIHAQDAADHLLAVSGLGQHRAPVQGETRSVGEVLATLTRFRDLYAGGDIPDLTDRFDLALFNTYRSHTFPDGHPFYPTVHTDSRGQLFETVRVGGGQTQVFTSSTRPGETRGDHFHRRKVERFQVVSGEARISLRRVLTDDVVTFTVDGQNPAMVDMPTLWAHNITNIGNSDLVTVFWASELHNAGDADTFREPVTPTGPLG